MSKDFDYTIAFTIDGGHFNGAIFKLDIEDMDEEQILRNLGNRLLECGLLQESLIDPENEELGYEEFCFDSDNFANVFCIKAPEGNTDWEELGVVFNTIADLDNDRMIIQEQDEKGNLDKWKAAIDLFGADECKPMGIERYLAEYVGQYKCQADYIREHMDEIFPNLPEDVVRYLDMDLMVQDFMMDHHYHESSGHLFGGS